MQHLSHLKALQALEAAIRLGTLKKAADELGVTAAALGQRIRTLEMYLGFTLMERKPRGAIPTAAAIEAAEELTGGFRTLEIAAKKLQFQRLNEVYIQADADWAELWLKPRLDTFRTLFPSIDVIVEDATAPIQAERRADFKVSFTNFNDSPETTTLFPEYLIPVSSPRTDRRLGVIPSARRLENYSLLHLLSQTSDPYLFGWPEWVEKFGHRKSVAGRAMQYARTSHALQAVKSNAGVLICGLTLAWDDIDKGAVTIPFDIEKGAWSGYSYQLEYNSDILIRPQTTKFLDWVLQEAAKTNSRLASTCPAIV